MGLTAAVACSRSLSRRGDAGEVISLHAGHWYAAWHSRSVRFDAEGCTWDGDDCRSSRCCSKPGSRCFVKNKHWASCNETCIPERKWQGYHHSRGHWTVTTYPVWECLDITAARTVAATTAAPTVVEVPVPAPSTPPSTYKIYEERPDSRTIEYGDRQVPKSSASASSSEAVVTYVDDP